MEVALFKAMLDHKPVYITYRTSGLLSIGAYAKITEKRALNDYSALNKYSICGYSNN